MAHGQYGQCLQQQEGVGSTGYVLTVAWLLVVQSSCWTSWNLYRVHFLQPPLCVTHAYALGMGDKEGLSFM